jgi:hypothetical protein
MTDWCLAGPQARWPTQLLQAIEERRKGITPDVIRAFGLKRSSSALLLHTMLIMPDLPAVLAVLIGTLLTDTLVHCRTSELMCLWRTLCQLAAVYVRMHPRAKHLAVITMEMVASLSNIYAMLHAELEFYIDDFCMAPAQRVLDELRPYLAGHVDKVLVSVTQRRSRSRSRRAFGPIVHSRLDPLIHNGVHCVFTSSGLIPTAAGRLFQLSSQLLRSLDEATDRGLYLEIINVDRCRFTLMRLDQLSSLSPLDLHKFYCLRLLPEDEPVWLQPARGFVGMASNRTTGLLFGRCLGLNVVLCVMLQKRQSPRIHMCFVRHVVYDNMADSRLLALLAPTDIQSTIQSHFPAETTKAAIKQHPIAQVLLSDVIDVLSPWKITWASWITPELTYKAWRALSVLLLEEQPQLMMALEGTIPFTTILNKVQARLNHLQHRVQVATSSTFARFASCGRAEHPLIVSGALQDATAVSNAENSMTQIDDGILPPAKRQQLCHVLGMRSDHSDTGDSDIIVGHLLASILEPTCV